LKEAPTARQSWAQALANYKAARTRLNVVRQVALIAGADAFAAGCRVLFLDNPEFESFGWKQFTAECDCGLSRVVTTGGFPDINDAEENEVCRTGISATLQAAVVEFLKHFEDEDLRGMFGVNIHVTFYRDGTSDKGSYLEN
jgi:hypothetical protein